MNTIPILICILVIVGVISFFITTFNRIILLRNNVEKSFANIDVILKQRADEVPNLVRVVQQASNYEKETLESLTKIRTQFLSSKNIQEKIDSSNILGAQISNIILSIENYPDLKANQSYLQLQGRLSELENIIADRREFYNDSVNLYNIGIMIFPDLIFAKLMRYKKMNMLEITSEERQNQMIN